MKSGAFTPVSSIASGYSPPHLRHDDRPYTCFVSTEGITDEIVQQVADDLRTRYGLDDEDIRTLGSRLVGRANTRSAENLEFAQRFTDTHHETFRRLAE